MLSIQLIKLDHVDTDLQELTPGLQTALEQIYLPLKFTHVVYVLIFLKEKNLDPEVKCKTAHVSPLFSSTYKIILEPF